MSEVYTVKVEEGRPATSDGRPSAGPVYRCIYAKDGLMELPTGLESPWDFFRSLFYFVDYAIDSFISDYVSIPSKIGDYVSK